MLRITLAPAPRRHDPRHDPNGTKEPCQCNDLHKSPIQGASEFPLMYCIADACHRVYVAVPIEQWRNYVRLSYDRHKELYLPQLVDSLKNVLPFRRTK